MEYDGANRHIEFCTFSRTKLPVSLKHHQRLGDKRKFVTHFNKLIFYHSIKEWVEVMYSGDQTTPEKYSLYTVCSSFCCRYTDEVLSDANFFPTQALQFSATCSTLNIMCCLPTENIRMVYQKTHRIPLTPANPLPMKAFMDTFKKDPVMTSSNYISITRKSLLD